jgi:hypothetical protein
MVGAVIAMLLHVTFHIIKIMVSMVAGKRRGH